MRKLLLTLLLSITGLFPSNSGGNTNSYSYITNMTEYTDFVTHVTSSIENNNTYELSYSDNLPLYSPIEVDSILRIADHFGMRSMHPILNVPMFHKGIDFVAKLNTNILVTANGIVESVIISPYGYGNQVIVNHGDGYKTRYAHMNTILVKEGEFVNTREILGTVGTTGLSTGPHLHYEVMYNDTAINPLAFYMTKPSSKYEDEYLNSLALLDDWYKTETAITW